jgi:serine/threonine-protein kinase RsbW
MVGARPKKEGAVPVQTAVRVEFPFRDDLLVFARLAATTTASLAGFDVDEVEDLRLAVYECCLLLGDGTSGGVLRLSFEFDSDAIVVTCELSGVEVEELSSNVRNGEAELSRQIVDALVDSLEYSFGDGLRSARLALRRSSVAHDG